MKPDLCNHFEDIRQSIESSKRYTADRESADEYERDEETLDSVERRRSLIGETLFPAKKTDTNRPVTRLNKIIALRHILAHKYDSNTNSTISLMVKNGLLGRKAIIEELIKRFE